MQCGRVGGCRFFEFILEAGVPDRSTRLFCWKSWRGKGRGKPSSPGELEGKQGKLRGHREQGKLRGMEWMGTLGNSAGTESIRNFGMTDD